MFYVMYRHASLTSEHSQDTCSSFNDLHTHYINHLWDYGSLTKRNNEYVNK